MKIFWLAIVFCLSSCQRGQDTWVTLSDGTTYKLIHNETVATVIPSEPPSLDWLLSSDSSSSWIEEHLMDGLVGFDLTRPGLQVVPALATEWSSSRDGKTWTFELRRNVHWTDGVPFTSKHVIDGFKRILNPDSAAIAVDNIFPITGAQAFNKGQINDFTKVGVKALSTHRVRFDLKEPMAFFPMLLTHHTTFPVRQDIINKFGSQWTEPENIVSLGPYKMIHWHHDSRLILTRNKNYWAGPVAIKNLVFYMVEKPSTTLRMFERGKLDLVRDLPSAEIPRLSQRKEFYTHSGLRLYYYGFKVNKKPFNDSRVRRAFSYAIDRDEVIKVLAGGQKPLRSWVPHGMPGYEENMGLRFDVQKARKLFAEAGFTDPTSFPLVVIGFNTDEKHQRVAENIQAQLKRNLNVRVELKNEEWKTFLNGLRSESSYSLFRLGWVADYADPHNFMSIMTSFSANNRTGWINKEYDELITLGLKEQKTEERLKIYKKAQHLLVEKEVPVLPILTDVNQVLVSPRLKNFKGNLLDLYQFHRMELRP